MGGGGEKDKSVHLPRTCPPPAHRQGGGAGGPRGQANRAGNISRFPMGRRLSESRGQKSAEAAPNYVCRGLSV